MRLGIGSYTYTWAIGLPGQAPPRPMTAFDLLDEAAALGAQVVQLCDNLPLDAFPETSLTRLESQSRDLRVDLELGTRGILPDRLRAYLRLCVRLQSPVLRLVVDRSGDEPPPNEIVHRLKPICGDFAKEGVRLLLENHDRFASAILARLVEELGSDAVGICLDTVNSFGALEGPAVVLRNLVAHTQCVHVKDFTIRRPDHQMGFVIEGCAAGRGRLDIPTLLAQLRGSSPCSSAILETWVSPCGLLQETIDRERAWTVDGFRYLQTLIPNLSDNPSLRISS